MTEPRCFVCEHPASSHPTDAAIGAVIRAGIRAYAREADPRCELCGCRFSREGVAAMHSAIDCECSHCSASPAMQRAIADYSEGLL